MSTVSIERIRHLNGEKPRVFAELEETIDKIQQLAFSFFEKRGERLGMDLEDWLLAEHEVFGTSLAELVESPKDWKLKVAVPGVESKDVTVTATAESLIVQANLSHRHSDADGEIRFCEFSREALCRQFSLASPIDVNSVSASLDKGVLNVVAAKAAKSRPNETVEVAKPWKEMFSDRLAVGCLFRCGDPGCGRHAGRFLCFGQRHREPEHRGAL
jgi:HSP20 family molecular chaperone IbpA